MNYGLKSLKCSTMPCWWPSRASVGHSTVMPSLSISLATECYLRTFARGLLPFQEGRTSSPSFRPPSSSPQFGSSAASCWGQGPGQYRLCSIFVDSSPNKPPWRRCSSCGISPPDRMTGSTKRLKAAPCRGRSVGCSIALPLPGRRWLSLPTGCSFLVRRAATYGVSFNQFLHPRLEFVRKFGTPSSKGGPGRRSKWTSF